MAESFGLAYLFISLYLAVNANSLLSLLGLTILAIIFISMFPKDEISEMRYFALYASIICFLMSCLVFLDYTDMLFYLIQERYIFEFYSVWVELLNFRYVLGIDGISIFFILLTTFLIPLCVLCSWESVTYRLREFLLFLFLIEFLLLNVFCVLDLLLFYIFFESILIPMFLLIGIWGSRERKIQAAYQFFFYTLFGSLVMLVGILFLYDLLGSTDIRVLSVYHLSVDIQKFIWLSFFLSFAIKMPMVPVHLWLPEAHVEAPTAGSVLLAGILLKMGGYGIIRFMLPVLPEANLFFKPFVFVLSLVGIIYSSLTTLRQVDLKKVIAYSSVAHMNFVVMGIFSETFQGISGSIYLMLTHGIVSSGLFLCIGILYERYGSRLIAYYGGLVQFMPLFSLFFFFLLLSNMGLPLTGSFVAETLILFGLGPISLGTVSLAFAGILFGGIYSIWLFNRVCFGELKPFFYKKLSDVNKREFLMIFPLFFLSLYMGVYSQYVLYLIMISIFLL